MSEMNESTIHLLKEVVRDLEIEGDDFGSFEEIVHELIDDLKIRVNEVRAMRI